VPNDDSALHDKGGVLEGGDVVERISGDGDDVGEFAGLEGSEPVIEPQQLRSAAGRLTNVASCGAAELDDCGASPAAGNRPYSISEGRRRR
jgi:hypothetical protein